jgi:GAF domain-containing protein
MDDAPLTSSPGPAELTHLREENARLNDILGMLRSLGFTLGLEDLLEKMLSEITRLLRADRASIFLLDAAKDELWTRVAQGLETSEIRFAAGIGLAGACVRQRATLNIPDAYDDQRFNRSVDQKTGYRTRSVLTVPMHNHKGAISGVIQALNKDGGGPFTARDDALPLAGAAFPLR